MRDRDRDCIFLKAYKIYYYIDATGKNYLSLSQNHVYFALKLYEIVIVLFFLGSWHIYLF